MNQVEIVSSPKPMIGILKMIKRIFLFILIPALIAVLYLGSSLYFSTKTGARADLIPFNERHG